MLDMKGNTVKETKLQRDVRLLRAQIARLEMQRNGALAALVNAEIKLPGLRKNLERLRLRLASKLDRRPVSDPGVAQDPSPVPVAHVAEDRRPALDAPAPVQDKPGDKPLAGQLDDIPEFLRRGMAAQRGVDAAVYEAAHAVANKHNKLPTEDQKKLVAQEKRKVKKEHLDAELTGAKRKPPLTGRAAEAFLRGR